tara:strand:- start:323 stop:631 length:309 start_codon:yes stop_codon:yes gene_type:complete
MKITKRQLLKIINEELSLFNEAMPASGTPDSTGGRRLYRDEMTTPPAPSTPEPPGSTGSDEDINDQILVLVQKAKARLGRNETSEVLDNLNAIEKLVDPMGF